jgi:hypothetical protein
MNALPRRIAAAFAIFALLLANAAATQIYSGEPLDEAFHDLDHHAVLVAHALSSAAPLLRTDVFQLSNGRLVAVTSRASKPGRTYVIELLCISSPAGPLTRHSPTAVSVEIPNIHR